MITFKTVVNSLNASSLKKAMLQNYSRIAQGVLLVFMLTVIAATWQRGSDRCEVAVLENHQASLSYHTDQPEHEVLEDGDDRGDVTQLEQVMWRWDERPVVNELSAWAHVSAARSHVANQVRYKVGTFDDRGQSSAPGLLVLPTQKSGDVQAPQIFYAREVDAIKQEQRGHFSQVFTLQEDVAYVAYFPRGKGIGVEVYAVDIRHNSPLWRTTVRGVDFSASERTEVQLYVHEGRLQVMTKEGDLRRVDSLSAKTGEILHMEEVARGLTELPVRESMTQDFYRSCLFSMQDGKPDARQCKLAPERTSQGVYRTTRWRRAQNADMVQLVRQKSYNDTAWRLNLVGQQFAFFPVQKVWPEPTSDVLLSYTPGRSASVITAIHHERGEVLWSTGLNVLGRDVAATGKFHHDVSLDVQEIGGEPVLVVYGEEAQDAYVTYLDPATGLVRSTIRTKR